MKTKTIGVITLQDNNNYGNRLQNYATQSILQNMGYTSLTIENYGYTNFKKFYWLHRIKNMFSNNEYSSNDVKRCRFKSFNDYIRYDTNLYRPYYDYKKMDYVIVGSDQVWHPEFGASYATLLSNISPSKRVAFSASFGVTTITQNIELYKENLPLFKALSVREEAGAKIIKELTGRDATVLVDPTMLLTQEEWRKVSKKPRGAKEGYILTYFLSPKCDEAKTKLEAIREDREVYELLNPNDKVAGTAGPSEFLWLFDHADLILTDSFHACVFSFLFNKPFIVYDRNWDGGNMNSRLETLLSKFSLERKYANSGIENDIWEHDYTEGYKQLEIERKKAIDFLKKALED